MELRNATPIFTILLCKSANGLNIYKPLAPFSPAFTQAHLKTGAPHVRKAPIMFCRVIISRSLGLKQVTAAKSYVSLAVVSHAARLLRRTKSTPS